MPDQFKADVASIMADEQPLTLVVAENPASLGWLRRSEFDVNGARAWERPDGAVVGVMPNPLRGTETDQRTKGLDRIRRT